MEPSSILLGAVCGSLLLLAAGAIATHNRLVELRGNADKAWHNVEVLLLQRHDELLELVGACRGSMAHEADVLERCTALRVGYERASGPDARVRVENELNRNVAELRRTLEGYPLLEGDRTVLRLQRRVAAVEDAIAERREFFNSSVHVHNVEVGRFPSRIFAGLLGHRRRAFLELPEAERRDAGAARGLVEVG